MAFRDFVTSFSGSFTEEREASNFKDTTLKSTTSNNLVEYGVYFSSEDKSSGVYRIDWSADMTNSKKDRRVAIQVEWRIVGNSWQAIDYGEFTPGVNESFQPISSFSTFDLVIDAEIEFRVLWGVTIDGGTGRIKNVKINSFRYGDV